MGENNVDIEIIQIVDPWNFQAFEKPGSSISPASQEFQRMHEDMNQYCNQLIGTEFCRPNVGDVCGALSRDDDSWHRVRIERIISKSHGQQACCFMIDTGSQLTVSALRMMRLPKKFQEVPPQVHQCCLWGVQPLTLKIIETDTGLCAKSRPCSKWDPAAIEYMQRKVDESQGCQAEIINRDSENTLFLRLYLITRKGLVCFNEVLVDENYALKVDNPDCDFRHKRPTGLGDTSLKETCSSLSLPPCNTKSILQSVLDEMPLLIPFLTTDVQQSSTPKNDNTNSSTRSRFFCSSKQERTEGQQNLSCDSIISSARAKSDLSMNATSGIAQDILPVSELKFCSKSPTSDQDSLMHNRHGNADVRQMASIHNKSPLISSSKLAKLSVRESLSTADTVTDFSCGRGRIKEMSTLPQNKSSNPLQNKPTFFLSSNSSSQSGSIETSPLVAQGNCSSFLSAHSPSHSGSTDTSPLLAQGNRYSFLSAHSPSHSGSTDTSPLLAQGNRSSFLSAHSTSHSGSSETSPLVAQGNHSSFLSAHSPSHSGNTNTSPLVAQDNCSSYLSARSPSHSDSTNTSPLVAQDNCSSFLSARSPSHSGSTNTSPLLAQGNCSSYLSARSPSHSGSSETSPLVAQDNHFQFLSAHSGSIEASPLVAQRNNSSFLSSHSSSRSDSSDTSSLVAKRSLTNTGSVATPYTNLSDRSLQSRSSDLKASRQTGLTGSKLLTLQQPKSYNTSPAVSSDKFKINSTPAGDRCLEESAHCDARGASVKPHLTMKDTLAQSSFKKEDCLIRLQEKIFKEKQRQDHGYKIPLIARQDMPIPRPIFGVLVHGKSVPSLICDVEDVPFKDSIKSVLQKLNVDTARSIQAYVWPAALGCRHIVGICPPDKGKTMSYVPAVVSQLLDHISYSELPPGKGPIALVIVPSWKKGRNVLEMVKDFTFSECNSRKPVISNVLYAGGIEENDNTKISLLQGCDILIATPQSLLRMLDQDITSLKRLCHIILDDAEILAARFAKEVENVMQLYKLQLKELRDQKKCLNVPRQIMIFATQWSSTIEEFYLKYTVEPVIAISSRVEASIYGGVKQIVTMTKWEQRLTTFCGLLGNLSTTRHRVAAFTQDVEEAVMMYKAAKSRDVQCLLIHENLQSETINEVRHQWLHSSHSNMMVMICTDQCYQDLAITNATMIVHYGLPDSKTKFGNRLACMMDYFLDRTSNIKPDVEPVSQVILTNRCAPKAQSLYEILQRCPAEFSPQLEKFLQGYKLGVERDPRKILCPFLKSFGVCSNHDKCDYRHLVIPEQDFKAGEICQNTLPSSGEVKIKVIRVENASRFYCHMVNHRSVPDNVKTDLRLEYQRLLMEMVSFFSKESNHVPFVPSDDPFLDDICAFKDSSDIFYRAKVLEVRRGSINAPMQCKVWVVDAGRHQIINMDQLLRLPQKLAEVAYQAVEVYLCCVRPMDNDSEWTCEADTYMNDLIQGKELVGRIMLRVGLTLWLLPLVHQVTLKNVGVTSDVNIRQELLGKNLGTPNPEHIQKLYEFFRGHIEIPEKLMRQYFDYALEMEMLQETLATDNTFYEVTIAAVISPGLMYVQKWQTFELLDKLEAQIADVMRRRSENDGLEVHKVDADIKLEQGSVCLALSSDGRWYRAKIVSDLISGQWGVFFLDYGDRENVSEHNLRPLPRELAELPCQAIECELAYIQPHAGNWGKHATSVICDLAYFVNEEKKQLLAKVVRRLDPCYGIGQKLVIDLYDDCVRFSQELVWRHVAKCAQEPDTIQDLVGKPALKNQLFFNSWDKIPYLCANIYWCEIHSDAIQQASELCDILSNRDEGWESNLLQREVMSSAFRVVGYIPDTEAHGIILDCLVSCCLDSDRLTEIAVSENLASRLAFCLEQVSKPRVQLQAAQAVAQLVSRSRFCESLSSNDLLVTVLFQFLNQQQISNVELETLKCVCSASAQLVQTDLSVCNELKSAEMVKQIFCSLEQTSADTNREPWLELLAAIATWESSHKCLMREAHIAALMKLLLQCSCCKCLYHLLSVCQSLVQSSRRHKVILLENKLIIILNDLEASGLRSPALEVCKQLQADMTLTLPQPEGLAGLPVRRVTEGCQIVSPRVTWSQNCFKLLLNVKVRGAKVENFFITESRISCRCTSDGVKYELDWELYDSILPAKSKVQVYASYSLVSLWKQTKGKWSRLLKQKIKLPNLSLDFEHPDDSADEDVEDEENITTLTKKKDIFNQEQMWRLKRVCEYQSSEESSDELAYYSHNSDEETYH